MKRIILALALGALVAVALTAGAQTHASKSHAASIHVTAVAAAVPVAKSANDAAACGSHCSGSCPLRPGTSTSAATAKYSFNGQACPVSDPSQCPASCPRTSTSASAVAANTSK